MEITSIAKGGNLIATAFKFGYFGFHVHCSHVRRENKFRIR